jgi:ElaA protein
MTEIAYRAAGIGELDPMALYRLLRLRVEVFVVEQKCPYQELDGRDLERGTLHLWAEDGMDALGYLRMLSEHDGSWRIGRVCTALAARGQGIGQRLLRQAIERAKGRPIGLRAQAHLTSWYARLGFAPDGEQYLEDGIPHVPMRRQA